MAENFCRNAINLFFEYETPKIVHIKSKTVGALNRFIQLCIIGYVIGYAIVYQKGYQEFETAQSAVTTKLKGIVKTNNLSDANIESRIWDAGDYAIPPKENGAFFVMTKVLVTSNQTLGICPEDWNVEAANCTGAPDKCDQFKGKPIPGGNGIATGKCISAYNSTKPSHVCEVEAWCPVEIDDEKNVQSIDSSTFTVLIKNNIEFSKFKVKKRNILLNYTADVLKNCSYNPNTDPYCPIFIIKDILKYAKEKYSNICDKGAVINIIIRWHCNFDWNPEYCRPQYSFERLDHKEDTISKGFNFRFADHYINNNIYTRTLYKTYGIRFIITVETHAGKFYIVPLIFNLGAGLALLSITTIICDIVVLYFNKKRHYYYEKKYLQVLEESTEISQDLLKHIAAGQIDDDFD